MSIQVESEVVASSSAQMRQPRATIENIVEELRRVLNSIQAIAYYVEMTLPISELPSLEYLRKVQELVDECHEILHPLAHGCTATENSISEAIEANPDHEICVESAGGCLT